MHNPSITDASPDSSVELIDTAQPNQETICTEERAEVQANKSEDSSNNKLLEDLKINQPNPVSELQVKSAKYVCKCDHI